MNLATLLPPKARRAIYAVLSVVIPLEAIFHVLPEVWDGKVLQALAALGFVLAAGNVDTSV